MTTATIHKAYTPIILGKMLLLWWKYRMKLPESWAEMTPKQAIIYIRMMQFPTFEEIKHSHYTWRFRNRFLKYLMMDKKNWFGKHYFTESDFFSFGDHAIHSLMERTDKVLKSDAAHPAVKVILVKLSKLYLPAYNMQCSSFIEFAMAEEYYYHIGQGTNIAANLNRLCATLCRPRKNLWWLRSLLPDSNGDPRIAYDDTTMVDRAKDMAIDLSDDMKRYIYFYYQSCRKNFIEMYPAIFSRQTTDNSTTKTTNYRFIGALHQVAQEGAFGKWTDVAHENMHLVLHYINCHQDKIKEAQERINQKH